MNLMLHGIEHPRFFYRDTLSKEFTDKKSYDLVLMNPPFKGKIAEKAVDEKAEDKSANGKKAKQSAKGKLDLGLDLPTNCTKSELLFLHLILRVLDMGGRCAVIVPGGVLFGSSKQHQEIRKKIVEENRLDGVVSMPSGVFQPYATVSTAVLLFTRGGTTDKIWFYDMEHDGFSLDDKRQPVAENDIPDILTCWKNRFNPDFTTQRAERLSELKSEIAPMKAERLKLLKEINRLTFENAVAPADDEPTRLALECDRQRLAQLHEQMAPLQAEINQLNRQFWVAKAQVKANKYDLSASRYRQIEQDEPYYESPQVTMERLLKLDHVMETEVQELMHFMELN
jgi:type I restriction enzyme M protein